MLNPEMFIMPGVLEILAIHGDSKRARILEEFYPDRRMRFIQLVEALSEENRPSRIPPSSINRFSEELAEIGLLQKYGRGNHGITSLGKASVEASRNFHDKIKNPLFESRRSDLVRAFGEEQTGDYEELFLREEGKIAPWTRNIMKVLSDSSNVRTLLVISKDPELESPFQLVFQKVSEYEDAQIPQSTFSNQLTSMVEAGLIVRPSRGLLRSTSLGIISTEGFVEFQDSLQEALVDNERNRLHIDLGIEISS